MLTYAVILNGKMIGTVGATSQEQAEDLAAYMYGKFDKVLALRFR